jgi:P4 family phage/plasmid primase-like protien
MSFLWLNKNFISNENITHTSFMGGKWSIPNDKLNEFYKLCENEMQNGKINYYIERPQKIGMLLIDIDLRFDYDEVKERTINDKFIDALIDSLIKNLQIYLDKNEKYLCYVLMRERISKPIKNVLKDGLHIYFPHIITDRLFQYNFRKHYIPILKQLLDKYDIEIINDIEDVYDKCIIEHNGLVMYGSTKKEQEPYKIHKIYNGKKEKSIYETLCLLSLQNKYNACKIIKNFQIEKETIENIINTINNEQIKENEEYDPGDLCVLADNDTRNNYIEKLLNLLPNKYYDDYYLWIKVGLALFNTSEDYLVYWDDWSKKSTKYEINTCKKIWKNFSKKYTNPITIKSIHKWVNEAEPEKYIILRRDYYILDCICEYKKLLPKECDLKISNIVKNQNNYVIRYDDKYCPISNIKHEASNTFSEILKNGTLLHRCSNNVCDGKIFNIDAMIDQKIMNKLFENNSIMMNYVKIGSVNIVNTNNIDNNDTINIINDDYDIFADKKFNKLVLESLSGTPYDIAAVLHYMYRDEYVYSSKTDRLYRYNKHYWILSDDLELKKNISTNLYEAYKKVYTFYNDKYTNDDFNKDTMQKRVQIIKTIMSSLKKTAIKKNIMTELQEHFDNGSFEEKLDKNINLLCFTNGVYDLKTMQFRDGKKDDYVSMTVGYDYDPNSKNSLLNESLEQILPIDNVRNYVLKVLSTCLSGIVKNQKFFCFSGTGSNGKSFLLAIIKQVLGDYFCAVPVSLITQKRGLAEQASPQIMKTINKRMIVFSEPNKNDVLNVGIIKEMSGSDTISARQLNEKPIEFVPQFKMFLLCNFLPYIDPNEDYSTWRRIRNIQFISTFVDKPNPENKHEFQKNEDLENQIINWRMPFMNILLKYFAEYIKEGLNDIPEVMQSTDEYKDTDDFYKEFTKEYITKTDNKNDYIKFSTLKTDFEHWYHKNFHKIPPKMKEIKQYFEKKIFMSEEKQYMIDSKSNHKIRGWIGYKCTYDPDMDCDE